jgi:uncharacterized protein YpmB
MRNKLLIMVGAIVLFAVAMGSTVFILNKVANPASSPDSSMASDVTSQIIVQGLRDAPIASLAPLKYQTTDAQQFIVSAQPENNSFTVSVPADAVVVYQDATQGATLEKEAVLHESKEYFTSMGFSEKTTTGSGATFMNDNVTCQVQVQATGYATVSFACADAASQRAEYEAVMKLIGVYNQAASANAVVTETISTASRTIQKKDAVEGALLALSYKEPKEGVQAGLVLLFGGINHKWEYIANVSEGSSTGKANVPESALKAIKDAKWQGVLAGLVGV